MRFLLYVAASITIASCAAKPIAIKNPPQRITDKTVISRPLDSVWNDIMFMCFDKGYTIKTKDKANGNIVIGTERVSLTTLNKEGNPENKSSMAFTEVRMRINNRKYVYARKGNVEWNILLQPNGSETYVFVKIAEKGTMTDYYFEGFEVKKSINNINVWSTGIFEKQLQEMLK